jgi:uncharacterized membrane protein YdfJ with MMPL/SSD domain
MEAWLPVLGLAAGVGVIMFLIARYQTHRYQTYLDGHTAATDRLVAAQAQTLASIERQTVALERIAAALEKRP